MPEPVEESPPTWAVGMQDGPSGLRSLPALRRDLVLEQAWPSPTASRVGVFALTLSRTGRGRNADRGTLDLAVRLLAEAATETLAVRHLAYRTGPAEVALVFRNGDAGHIQSAIRSLEEAMASRLSEHALPALRLGAAFVDPHEAVQRLHDHGSLTGGGGVRRGRVAEAV